MIEQIRSTHRYTTRPNPFKDKLRDRVVQVATEYGRYGYRPVTDLLRMEGWDVGKDAVYTIWREEGLKVPQKQPKRAPHNNAYPFLRVANVLRGSLDLEDVHMVELFAG